MLNETKVYFYQTRLREELVKRVKKNPRYSLRSFASALGVAPSALSRVLGGKRTISMKLVERIFNVLELSPREQKSFLESLLKEKMELGVQRVSPDLQKRIDSLKSATVAGNPTSVGLEEFRIIADWYHYAILELTLSKCFKAEIKWIAKQLSISEIEAKLAIDRLFSLELLEKRDGTWKKTSVKLETKDRSKTSSFHRTRQKQILGKAIDALESVPIERRNQTSMTFCIDPAKIPEAKEKVQKFMWEMSELLMEKQEQVYELSVSLFPLQNP